MPADPPPEAAAPHLAAANEGSLAAHLIQILTVTSLGTGIIMLKVLVDIWSPWHVVALMMTLGALGVWTVMLLFHGLPRPGLPYGRMILYGAIAPGCAFLFNVLGLSYTDAVSGAIIWGLVPLLIPILGVLILKERLQRAAYLGALVGFVMVIWLMAGRAEAGAGDWFGNALIFGAIFCASASQIFGRAIFRRKPPFMVMAAMQLTGASLVAVTAALLFGPPFATLEWSERGIAHLGVLIGFSTWVNFLCHNFALSRLPVGFMSLYITLVPGISTAIAALYLDAPLTWQEALAIGIMIAAVLVPSALRILAARRAAPGG